MKRQAAIGLSKVMSLALRHRPEAFDLTLDPDGWVNFEQFAAAIAARSRWHWVTPAHIQEVVHTSDKQRFELRDGRIRARYGHSRAARPDYRPVEPPQTLYHGTPRRNLEAIRKNGLKAMSRQYVHLSATPEMALTVGRRRDPRPALLVIRARQAHADGVTFGTPSGRPDDDVYLVDAVPPRFIETPESP